MEQQRQWDAQATPEFGTISEKEFYDGITIKKDDRYGIIFFALNTLLLFNITIITAIAKNYYKKKTMWSRSFVTSLIVAKSAKYLQCFMILSETVKKDLTWRLYADIMTDFMMS